MGKKTPKAPDPAQTIAAQSAANKEAITESARVNAVDQYGPGGSTTYTKDANGVPTAQTVKLTPSGQATYNMQEQIAQGLTDKAGQLAHRIPTGPMDISGLPARQTAIASAGAVPTAGAGDAARAGLTSSVAIPDLQRAVASRANEVSNLGMQDYGAATKATQDATFGKAQSLLQPRLQLERQRLEQSLSDRGIPLDSAAGRAELTRMATSQSEANARSAYDAVAAGSAEQSRLFGLDATRTGINNSAATQRYGMDLSSGQFANDASGMLFGMGQANAALNNAAQGQAFGQNMASQQAQFGQNVTNANFNNDQRTAGLLEALALRNQDFNEASALLQGAPVMGAPSFQNTPTYSMQPVDAAGIINTNYAQRAQAAQANSPWQGLFGLGSAAITAFSDRRIKTHVEPIGTGWRGLPLYLFRYLGGAAHRVGVMAQDVARVAPDAVRTVGDLLAVDYSKLAGDAA